MKKAHLSVLTLVFSLLILSFFQPAQAGDLGYSSSFQNPKAEFYGVEYAGTMYTPWDYGDASMHRMDTQLKFDPDQWDYGKPNLLGSMTSVFIPSESLISIPSWLPIEWLGHTGNIQNPVNEVAWNISGNAYKMRIWYLHFFVSLNIEWDDVNEVHSLEYSEQFYSGNDAVWIKFDLEPTYYIQGASTAYFAIGQMQLYESVEYRGWEGEKDLFGNKIYTEKNPLVSVSPEDQGSLCYIYYNAGGSGGRAEAYESYYQGKLLNPDLFTNAVYARSDLNRFGARSWWDWFTLKRRGDTAVFSFTMKVFEIGEWTVQDIQDDPSSFGRFVRQDESPLWGFDWVFDNLWWIVPAGVFIALLFLAPWVIIALIAIFKSLFGGK